MLVIRPYVVWAAKKTAARFVIVPDGRKEAAFAVTTTATTTKATAYVSAAVRHLNPTKKPNTKLHCSAYATRSKLHAPTLKCFRRSRDESMMLGCSHTTP